MSTFFNFIRLRLPMFPQLFTIFLLFSSTEALAIETCELNGNGQLSIYSYHLDEYLSVTYKTNGSYNQASLEKIYRILRSPDGEIYPINLRIIDLIDDIQDHFGARTIEIISGYRSPPYNNKLKTDGRRVASESLHMRGDAVDIHIDEVTEEAIRDYALSLGCGGVGFYAENDFVHLDIGPIKKWDKEETSRKLVGMENNISLNRLITEKNDYYSGEEIKAIFSNKSEKIVKPVSCVALEIFQNGTWQHHENIIMQLQTMQISPAESTQTYFNTEPQKCQETERSKMPFGRYRIKMRLQSKNPETKTVLSNEFYLKKNSNPFTLSHQ